jgi:dihydroorotate dehydrogenase electron transfer subunit
MRIEQARIVEQTSASGEFRLLVLDAPDLAGVAQPGQFVHLRVPRLPAESLRRPFSVFDAGGGCLRILYKRVGTGTRALSDARTGEAVEAIGPLGRGFPLDPGGRHPVLVAGGYGVAPLHFLAARMGRLGTVFLGGVSAASILCETPLRAMGWDVRVSTEDGSAGEKGLVTEALDRWLAARADSAPPEFYACGPDGMLRAVAERAAAAGCKAWVSLERRMGCGVGACLSCVVRVRGEGGERWARVCRDGPVFEGSEVVWQ